MSTISGVVESKSRNGTGIKVNGTWYNGKTDVLRDVQWKSNVTIEVDGKNNITSVVTSAGTPAANTNAATNAGSSNNWDSRQEVIVFQSARNAAIELLSKLTAEGAVSLPTKKEEKYAAAMAFIDEHTALFHKQAMNVYGGMSVEEAINEANSE